MKRTIFSMFPLARTFWTIEQGQDLTEYSLMLAFVVLAAAGIFTVNGASLANIWTSANLIVNQAASRSIGS
jgi:Flp pilus assembly pilin Flp